MASGNGEQVSDQFKAIDVADGFHDHDMAALARLTAAGRAEQVSIRERLYRYIDAMWEQAKASHRGPDGDPAPLAEDPVYSAMAGMRDLAGELHGNALAAVKAAGEEPG